jgi:hypothetical protein
LVNDDVELEVGHRWTQILRDGLRQQVDFVNEQHIAGFEVR